MTERPHDLGVLVVHGIGDQQPGGTLREFGALVGCVARWAPNGLVACEQRGGIPDIPGHMTIEVTDVGGAPLRVLVVEGHWADTVPPPGTLTLLKWLGSVVPFVVPRVLDGQVRLSSERMDAAQARWHPRYLVNGLLRLGLNVATVVATVGSLLGLLALWLLGIPRAAFDDLGRKRRDEPHDPLWVAVLGGLVLGLVLVGAVRVGGRAGWIGCGAAAAIAVGLMVTLPRLLNSVIARFIGDCYALLRRKDLRDAMIARVEGCLQWLEDNVAPDESQRRPPIVVVAHSQGAEVVRRVLDGRTTPIDGLVTLGSGIEKLWAVGRLRQHAWQAVGLLILRAISAALVVLAVLVVWPGAPAGIAWWFVAPAIVVAWLLLTLVRAVLKDRLKLDYTARELTSVRAKIGSWADFYAAPDPVPEGALPIGPEWGSSKRIDNGRVFLLDHIRYWHNVQGFLAPVMLDFAVIAQRTLGEAVDEAVRHGAVERRNALKMRVALRWAVAAGLAITIALLACDVPAWAVVIAAGLTVAAALVLVRRIRAARQMARTWSPCR